MRKLLTALTAILVTATPVGTLISCGPSSSNDTPSDNGSKEVEEFLTDLQNIVNSKFSVANNKVLVTDQGSGL